MQRRLVLKFASDIPRKLSGSTTTTTAFSSLLHSHRYKTFASLTRTPQTLTQNHFLGSSLTNPLAHYSHSWRFSRDFSEKIHGFLSNPLLAKQLLASSNTLLRVSKRSLLDFRVAFLKGQFPKQSFEFNSNYRSYRRGWRSWFQGLSTNDVVLGLIIANVAVFLLWQIADPKFMMNNFTISLDNVKHGRLHTVITSAFSHKDTEHIFSNMLGLYFFGQSISRSFGPAFLLKLYLAGAIGGSVFFLVHHAFLASQSKSQLLWKDPSRTPGLGASGAVNAIMLLNIFLFPTSTIYFNFFIPVPAMLMGIFLVGKDMLRIIQGDTNISGSAHLGGAAVAAIAWARIRKRF
ncbi:hypothetical protein FNV43_RR20807 [Rhamnella rubrinervis]|uniref:Peptidase S54 rhomboid domain-containing protein n=1 Tax=Rhamnella rubrinervis TaxID=2594499 RepID=A0A8K0DWM6_9ROSA|nr:hypothetical protein FNV43_RR20807 [Rhamnella rubrinervis]